MSALVNAQHSLSFDVADLIFNFCVSIWILAFPVQCTYELYRPYDLLELGNEQNVLITLYLQYVIRYIQCKSVCVKSRC